MEIYGEREREREDPNNIFKRQNLSGRILLMHLVARAKNRGPLSQNFFGTIEWASKLECLLPCRAFQTLMLQVRPGAYYRGEHLWVGSGLTRKKLHQNGEACQRQTLQLIWPIRKLQRNKKGFLYLVSEREKLLILFCLQKGFFFTFLLKNELLDNCGR